MNVLAVMENGLFALGQLMRFPVMALLWACVLIALFLAGSCLMDGVARRRQRHGFSLEAWLKSANDPWAQDRAGLTRPLAAFLGSCASVRAAHGLDEAGLEKLLQEHEDALRSPLVVARALVKVAPSLGLLGTLIPMGTSLAALSTGALEAMSGQMVVAFTTTIIGLACGTTAYVVSVVRQKWLYVDAREQRLLAEKLLSRL
jgi:biopolymer transport protein ExbB/TolQ